MDDLKSIIGKVATGAVLTREEAAAAFDRVMSGEATPAQMGGLLMALRVRGETVDEITGAVSAMRAVCARYGTDLPTAALQFSVRDETFASTIVGMSRPERIAPTVAAAQQPLPADLFAELETLLPARELWLDAPL